MRLEPVSGRTVTVPWTTEALAPGIGSASPGTDYTSAAGTLTFTSGSSSARFEVATLPDEVSEADETFRVQLGTPTSAALDDSAAAGAIRDDDGQPRVFIADTTVNEDAGPAIFTVTLSHPSSQPVTVKYETADGTAQDPDDYAPDLVKTLTIPATFTGGEISVFINDDDISEGAETFTITLIEPVNAVIAEGAGTATGTILDDDTSSISIGAANADENDGTIEFPVTLSAASSDPVTVRYTTFDGTATQPNDYTATTGTLTLPAGSTAATVAVTLTDDPFVEEPESFLVRLSDPTGAEIATAEAVGVILDDDDLPLLLTSGTQYVREDAGTVDIVLTLDRPSDRVVTVYWRVTGGGVAGEGCPGIRAGVDRVVGPHSFEEGTIRFAPGDTSRIVTLEVIDGGRGRCIHSIHGTNVTHLPHSFVFLNLENAVRQLNDTAGFFLVDVESTPEVRLVPPEDVACSTRSVDFGRCSVSESAGEARFTFLMLWEQTRDVLVDYTVTAVSATAGVDYANVTSGTFTIPAGQREATLSISILDDSDIEGTEEFHVTTTGVTNGRLHYSFFRTIRMEIIDDDFVSIEVQDEELGEGVGSAAVRVALDGVAQQVVTVQYETRDGTATSPQDYTGARGTLTFEVGETEKYVAVPLVDDDVVEGEETFSFGLDNAVGAAISNLSGRATVTIIDDDGSGGPIVTLADHRISEGVGQFGRMTLILSEPSIEDVMVTWRLVEAPWLGDRAADHSDFETFDPEGSIETILAGQPSHVIGIYIEDDDIPEHDERMIVALFDPVNVIIGTQQAWVTILDDDLPVVSVANQRVSEAADAIQFELELHAPGVQASRVDYATVVRSSAADPATPGEDYIHTSGTAVLAPGVVTATVSVPIIGDSVDESDETFLLELSAPRLLRLVDSAAIGTVVDDDPGFWIDDRPGAWEDVGSMVFTVQRDHTSAAGVAVEYRFGSGGSAVGGTHCGAGVDFVWPWGTSAGTVTLLPAETRATIAVTVCDDDVAEGREILLIELTNVTGRKTTGVGTIVDDDRTDLPRINISDSHLRNEGQAYRFGGLQFMITADGTLTDTVTVTWRTEDCLATDAECPNPAYAGDDYTAAGGTVTLTPAQGSAVVRVRLHDDTAQEESEQFYVRITAVTGPAAVGSGATRTDPVGIGTIIDDDRTDLPRIDIGNSPSRTETLHDAVGGASFQISADGPLTDTVTVTWRTENCPATDTQCPHPATAGDDYIANSGTVTLTPINPSATVTVTVLNDTTHEDDEQFFVRITGVTGPAAVGSGVTHAEPVGIGFITDDDLALPRINISNSEILSERLHVALRGARFQISADGPLTGTVTVAWSTEDCPATDTECSNPATAGDDYIARSGTVTLTPDDRVAFVTVTVRDDTIDEPSEAFFVRITGVTGPAAVGSGVTHTEPVGIGFIIDDD